MVPLTRERGSPYPFTARHWGLDSPLGRGYDMPPDGSALLLLPAQRPGCELRVILYFDELARRKLPEAKQ